MGKKIVKSVVGGGLFGPVGNILGLAGGGGSGRGAGDPNMAFFDIEKELEPFKAQQQELLDASLARAQASEGAQAEVLAAMGEAAAGRGPSLAEAQLKQAQDRNLAQQLAAVQSQRGGSAAANQRTLIQSMSGSGRDLASQSAIERLKERDRFLQASTQAGQVARQDINTGVDLATMAKREKQQAELARAGADLARTQARKQQQGQLLGGVLGAGATLLASDEKLKNLKEENKKDTAKAAEAFKSLAASLGSGKSSSAGQGLQALAKAFADKGTAGPFAGEAAAAIPAALKVSDEDRKSTKKEPDVRDKFEDFLSKLESKSFTYKNPKAPGQSAGQIVTGKLIP